MFSLAALSFPISVVLLPFALFAAFYVIYGLSDLFLILKFGAPGRELYIAITAFVLGSLAIFSIGLLALFHYDLSYSVTFSELTNFLGPTVPKL